MQSPAMLAELAHRPEDGNPPLDAGLRAKTLESSGHGRRIGIVALVDQQHFAAIDGDLVPFAAALEPAEIGKLETRNCNVEPKRLNGSQDRKRVRDPMLAALRDGE